MTILERDKGLGMASVSVLSSLMVLVERIPFLLQLLSAQEPVLGCFEADEAELLLQLCSPELFEYWIRDTAPTSSKGLDALLFWKRRRSDCRRGRRWSMIFDRRDSWLGVCEGMHLISGYGVRRRVGYGRNLICGR